MAHRTVKLKIRRGRTFLMVALTLAVGALGVAFAQRPAQADQLFTQAQQARQEARTSGEPAHPDRPHWQQAWTLGEQALQLAPHDTGIERFLARTYSELNWYVRAYKYWLAFLDDGGSLDDMSGLPQDATGNAAMFEQAGTQLGFARYQAGDKQAALQYYKSVHEVLPEDPLALRWLGRITFEMGDPGQALPYWQALVKLQPNDQAAQYYLQRTQQQLSVGVNASDAFNRGVDLYGKGQKQAALAAFKQALAANPDYTEAAVWAGRTSLDLDQPDQAVGYWQQVTRARPNDAGAKYFLDVAQAESKWGVEAGKAFYQGQSLYEKGQVKAANQEFVKALRGNGGYLDAWVWAARTSQELGDYGDAVLYWQGVLQRSPDDSRAQYFLSQAKQQLDYGPDAGKAFVAGVQEYQAGDFTAAEKDLKAATVANPDFPAAWGTLGRLYFQQQRYAEAQDAFARALKLKPDDQSYAYFERESQRLSGQ
ncbi:MAG TPA: tetratricopeptide repeat protein [Trueperaceae bacterium]|nr:tetratricopeptide repeat protein [Trueperaceae bacterium]